jgi:hypothetical protein
LSALRHAFLLRSSNVSARLADQLGEGALGLALAAPTDFDFLLSVLEQPEVSELLRPDDIEARLRLRGLRARDELLAADGGVISTEEAAQLLGLTRQAVDKRRRNGRLLGLSFGRRGYIYPVWQFDAAHPRGVLPGLEAVLDDLRDHDPWSQLIFFVSPNVRLEETTPLACLRRNDPISLAAVRRAARTYGKHGAA